MAEDKFEEAIIDRLAGRNGFKSEGWTFNKELSGVKSDKLYDHWRDILNRNNHRKLDGKPLTDTEFQRLCLEIAQIKTPYAAQLLLTGAGGIGSLPLQRDDGQHVEIEIFYGDEVAGGRSEYEIVQQITFTDLPSSLTSKRRIDLLLLINGIPVAHVEEKDEHLADPWNAFEQFKKYADSGMYQGLFAFVQVQFILAQHSAHYFARPKDTASYNRDFVFGWRDNNGRDITNAMEFVHQTMGIPALHRLVTVNMIPDASTNNLMVMRSYQIQATRQILDRMRTMENNQFIEKEGGYVWHTTGSGKTVTSFKVAQLLANMPRVDDVLFIVDRVDLVNQTYENFRDFAYEHMKNRIQKVNAGELKRALKQDKPANVYLISVQGLDTLVRDGKFTSDKRMVVLMDEAHRSASGDSVKRIKEAFKKTTWFGFTGTPNFYTDEAKDVHTTREVSTADVFGERLHQYTIKDAIGDRNVLGFDVSYMRTNAVKDALTLNPDFTDKELEKAVYASEPYRKEVVRDIAENWKKNSSGALKAGVRQPNVFHGMLAVSGKEAVVHYYELFRELYPELRVAMSFSKDDDNGRGDAELQKALKKGIEAYSVFYDTRNFMETDQPERLYLNDITKRIAHKHPYNTKKDADRLDLVIVSDQLLTGFDSKYVNIIYFDKVLKEGLLIQAMSRTNRTIDRNAKPYGKVRFYRKGETMEENVKNALMIYTRGGKEFDESEVITDEPPLTAPPIDFQIDELNPKITQLQQMVGEDFSQVPKSDKVKAEFVKLASEVNSMVQRLVQQGYDFGQEVPVLDGDGNDTGIVTKLEIISEDHFGSLQARWHEVNNLLPKDKMIDLSDLSVELEKYAEDRIDYDVLVDLLNAYMDDHNAEKRAAVETHIKPMNTEQQDEIHDVLDRIDDHEITTHLTTETLKIERKKSRSIRTEYKIYKWADNQEFGGQKLSGGDMLKAYDLYRPGLSLNDNPKLNEYVDVIKDNNNIGFFDAADFEAGLMAFFETL